MKSLLLFSNSKVIFEETRKVIGDEYKLIWLTYKCLEESMYSIPDVVIMHFDGTMTKTGTYGSIIRVRGRLGCSIPILAVIEGGTPQDIYSTLKAGAFDYLRSVYNPQEYKKKIEATILWGWYLDKYGYSIRR